ncbi:MAG: hypothetical protein EXQ74_05325 [Thermoleophilia bacterium]|nr:hypothetical protein [Thermoleophilia bacterium]
MFTTFAKLTSPNMWEAFDNSIAPLPIRRIDFDDPVDVAQHDAIVELVKALESATEVTFGVLSRDEHETARRHIEALQDRLDELVLDLYGVSELNDRAYILKHGAPL